MTDQNDAALHAILRAIETDSLEAPWELDYHIDTLLDGRYSGRAAELVDYLTDEAQSFKESGMPAQAQRALKVAEVVRQRARGQS